MLWSSLAAAGRLARALVSSEDQSSTWCVLVAGGSAWSAIAQDYLNRADNLELLGVRRARVVDAGRGDASAADVDALLQRVRPSMERLDAVVLAVGIEDGTGEVNPERQLDRFERGLRDSIARALARARTVIVVRPSATETRFQGELDRRTAAIVRETGVAEVDPRLLLEPGPAHFLGAAGLTPAGCRILGEAVAQAVLRERNGHWRSRAPALRDERHADVA